MTKTKAAVSGIEDRKAVKVKTILISQPKPGNERNPYFDLAKKKKVKIDWRKFIQIEGADAKSFRKMKINPLDFSAIIFTSKSAITHFFRICEEFRAKMPQETKYFCSSEAIALYLQKFIEYRKRKVFFRKEGKSTLFDLLSKHKANENFLFTCAAEHKNDIPQYMDENEINYKKAVLYDVVSSDLSDLKDIYYDVIVFFSPVGVKSLFDNFPDFKQKNTRIAAFGSSTIAACEKANIEVDIAAPVPGVTSMTMAIEKYIDEQK